VRPWAYEPQPSASMLMVRRLTLLHIAQLDNCLPAIDLLCGPSIASGRPLCAAFARAGCLRARGHATVGLPADPKRRGNDVNSRRPEPDAAELSRALSETDVPKELAAFAQMGLRRSDLASALQVSTESIRTWKRGGPVRPQNREALDYLRSVVLTLLQTHDVGASVRWLTTAGDGRDVRPLDRVRDHHSEVVAAAARFVNECSKATDKRMQAPVSPAAASGIAEATQRSSTEVKTEISGKLRAIASKPASQQEMLAKIDELKSDAALLPNYVAPIQLIARIRREVEQAGTQPADAVVLRELTHEDSREMEVADKFSAWGNTHLVAGVDEPILVYALSMRVIQALRGADASAQAATRLFIAECRVKSAPPSGNLASFGDGAEIWRYLRGTQYHTSLVFDIDAVDYVRTKRVKRLLVGAQQLKEMPDGSYEIVATGGTDLLLTLARDRGLKVNVLAETMKGDEATSEHAGTSDWVVTIPLPSRGERIGSDIAPLQTSRYELCVIGGDELVTENWTASKTPDRRGAPA
jgi:translation initiation factor 2B subunit (eIF-2B alpha/beta/delta family)